MVTEIKVQAGDSVSEGQEVAVLEAMKMQMPIASKESGTVAKVLVNTGDFVNEGDGVIELS